MKRIKMLRTAPGSEEKSGVTMDYEQGTEHTVSDELADGFLRLGKSPACEVLSDTEEDELLGKESAQTPVLTDDVINDAVKRHIAGEYNLDYVVNQMSSYYKVDPDTLRAKLEATVALAKKMTQPSDDKNERQGRTRNK